MRRREFLGVLGGAAVWPLAARAQQPTPVVGFLHAGAPEANANNVRAFRNGLGETGHVEGSNVSIDFQWAYGDLARYKELAAELVRRQVAVIVTPLGTAAALAAKAATTTIPIVFSSGTDPVQVGLVPSLKRPGGNLTGVNYMQSELGAKRLGLLHEMVPLASRFALIVNPTNSVAAEATIKDVGTAAVAIGRQVDALRPPPLPRLKRPSARSRQIGWTRSLSLPIRCSLTVRCSLRCLRPAMRFRRSMVRANSSMPAVS
jgi:putative ABC transport system substrate-binding protein